MTRLRRAWTSLVDLAVTVGVHLGIVPMDDGPRP